MSNVKAISPKSVWTDSGEKWANYLSLTNFRDYHFDDGSGVVEYSLIGPDSSDGLTSKITTYDSCRTGSKMFFLGQIGLGWVRGQSKAVVWLPTPEWYNT